MEEYQEIIDFTKYYFFKGKATLKYGADLNRYRSEKSGINHFTHRQYYDVTIKEIHKINESEFKDYNPAFELKNIKGNVIGKYNEQLYTLKTDILYIDKKPIPNHVQAEGDELHGDFVDVEVVFKMNRPEKTLICKPNFATGREDQREDGLYIEYTTGVLLPDGVTCEMNWVKDGDIPTCKKDRETGNRETKDKCYRLEYYSGYVTKDNTCETYWGDWICNCTQDEWTGNEKELNGWIWREYFNEDCTTYWKKYKQVVDPPGCFSIILFLLALLWAAFCVYSAIKHNSFMPILFGVGIPLLLASFGYIINFFGRFSFGISRIFRWILNLLLLIFILSLLNGFTSLFDRSNWTKDNSYVEDTSWEQQDNVIVDPYEDKGSNYVHDPLHPKKKFTRIHLRWNDFSNGQYDGTFDLMNEDIRKSTYNLKFIESQHVSTFGSVYSQVYEKDKLYFNSLYKMLDSIRIVKNQNKYAFANTIVSMVQSIDYVLILDLACDDPSLLRNKELQEMKEANIPCEGFAPYGIKTPLEFLSTLKGDCDTRTLLLYTIFKHYNYDVAIINSEFYGHSMLGLGMEGGRGAYKMYNGKNYYFWETTSKGFKLGQLQRQMGILQYWKIEII